MAINIDPQQQARILEQKKLAEDIIKNYQQKRAQLQKQYNLNISSTNISGKLSLIIASQLGVLRATIISRTNAELDKAIQRFINTCPPQSTINRVGTIRNNLQQVLDSYQKRVQTFKPVVNSLNVIINTARILLRIYLADPKPSAVGGTGVPLGFINRNSDSIYKLNKRIDDTADQVLAVNSLINTADNLRIPLQEKLLLLESYIERCSLDNISSIGSDSTASVDNINTLTSKEDFTVSEDYGGYKLSLVQDSTYSNIAPRHYAIAQDNQGVVVLKGPSSFSSNPQVLLDELKFRIDNQLS
mgnify:CR=1 FL=1